MIHTYYDSRYKFWEAFDPDTGLYYRSDLPDGTEPFMRSFPNLLDVGIMGHCKHALSGNCLRAGVQCYQGGATVTQPNMALDNYRRIVDESKGKVMQIALGGRGDPNKHEQFGEILSHTRENGIVPNYTTSGMGLTDGEVELSWQYCGAVAVSWYGQDYTVDAIKRLIKAGVRTSIHYVLNRTTLPEAMRRLQEPDGFPEGVNAVVFLLHKPAGLGKRDEVLTAADTKEFFGIVQKGGFPYKIGFDACSVPGIVNFAPSLKPVFFDTCEGARFSMYITSDMVATPCSFDRRLEHGFDLANGTIQQAWDSTQFERFRDKLLRACPGCAKRETCMGGCPLYPEIVLCRERSEQNED